MSVVLDLLEEPQDWPDRACLGWPADAFFPDGPGPEMTEAKAVCRQCPRLARCAVWAQTAGLTDCVVASVKMPAAGKARSRAMRQLREVAADSAEQGGGAAWTAA